MYMLRIYHVCQTDSATAQSLSSSLSLSVYVCVCTCLKLSVFMPPGAHNSNRAVYEFRIFPDNIGPSELDFLSGECFDSPDVLS